MPIVHTKDRKGGWSSGKKCRSTTLHTQDRSCWTHELFSSRHFRPRRVTDSQERGSVCTVPEKGQLIGG